MTPERAHGQGRERFPWWLGLLGGLFLVFTAWLVVSSLRDPTPPTYAPTSPGDTAIADAGGARRVTLDARDEERWVSLDVATGRVRDGRPAGWDLAARRFDVIVNGGPALPGDAAVARAPGPAAEGTEPPDAGDWVGTERNEDGDLRHPLLEDWYEYDFFSHLLTPRSRTYVLRTTRGELVELRFLSYYCPGPDAGCVTLRFAPLGRGEETPAARGPAGGGP